MRLRRFEFGIRDVSADRVQVYARRGDGRLYLKDFAPDATDLLAYAERAFLADPTDWQDIEPTPEAPGLSLVWDEGARLYVSGEGAIMLDSLLEAEADLVVSMNRIRTRSRADIARFLAARSGARHVDRPMLDVLPERQSAEGAANARAALHACELALRDGQTVVIHCLMGIHRSVSVASVALARAGFASSANEAFVHIQRMRQAATWVNDTVEWLERL